MSIMLFNPTNEDFADMMFGGRGLPLAAGQKMKVEDAAGKHLLNAYTTRGLCILDFGDDENIIAEQGCARNLAFKKRHVSQHNQSNIARRQQGLPYRLPGTQAKQYAEELDLVLEEPYAPKGGGEGEMKIAALEATVASLSKMMEMMMSKMLVEDTTEGKDAVLQKIADKGARKK